MGKRRYFHEFAVGTEYVILSKLVAKRNNSTSSYRGRWTAAIDELAAPHTRRRDRREDPPTRSGGREGQRWRSTKRAAPVAKQTRPGEEEGRSDGRD